MIGIVDFGGQGETLNGFWQQVCEVRDLDLFRDLVFRFLSGVQHVRFVFNECPLEAAFGSVNVKALAVLPSHVVKETPNVRRDIAVFQFDVTALNGERAA